MAKHPKPDQTVHDADHPPLNRRERRGKPSAPQQSGPKAAPNPRQSVVPKKQYSTRRRG